MKLFCITIAYAPAVLVARSLFLYQKYRALTPYRHIVVQGHYPINELKNSNDVKLIVDCFEGVELWDPGKNLGSAQSQNWCLERLDIGLADYFINLDPDSACQQNGWDDALLKGFSGNCVLVSCNAPMVQRYRQCAPFEDVYGHGRLSYGIATRPTPFNLSMWRYSFIKEIGGIPQMGLWWGETEAGMFAACKQRGKFHSYSLDYMEDESGKFAQDRQHNEYKDAHMRSAPENQFLGSFDEYLRWKHTALAKMDTCKDLDNYNHP